MGSNNFAPFLKKNTSFIVKNIITSSNKTIKIFQYPIPVGKERDLLAIPGVAEAEIRASLLKGELLHKLLAGEISIVYSDIDLLQFNNEQKAFLRQYGLTYGDSIDTSNFRYQKKEDIQLVGDVDDNNDTFTIPYGKFINTTEYKIIVYKNGVKQFYLDDFTIAESEGLGTGYDTVIFGVPPTTTSPADIITADYYLYNE